MRAVFFGAPGGESGATPDFIVPELTAEELRVLGCLIEKQFLTPDVYPLTLHSLVTACNQKTSREPVTNYDDITVDAVLAMLQGRGLCAKISGADHRVPKFQELFGEKTGLRVSEMAVLCVMMLRGPQTLNELKVRTERIHSFADLEEVETVLEKLMVRQPQAFVVKLPRLSGQKEQRYMHLLAGAVHVDPSQAATVTAPAPREDRIGKLEAEVAALRETVARIEQQLADFRRQFE
jgi:uncharacterized protein